MVSISVINKIATEVKESVESKQTIPSKSNNYHYGQYGFILAQSVISPNKDISKTASNKCPKPSGSYISRNVDKKDYKKIAQYVVDFVKKNGRLPNYVQWGNYKIRCKVYIYCFAKIVVYYKDHKALPNYCNFNSKMFVKETVSSDDEVLDYFVKKFGKVTKIDDALEKIEDHGYGYYYDDKYSNQQSIDRMKNGTGVNCTDSCHVFWHIAKALGYEVQCLHVKCSDGDGHVRLKLRHKKYSNNEWFLRDPAAVLSKNGRGVAYNWCTSNFTLLATNPSWFLENINR